MRGQPLDARGPRRRSPQGVRRDQAAAQELTDQRLGQRPARREPVIVQPDDPGWALGRAWWDSDSTAENP